MMTSPDRRVWSSDGGFTLVEMLCVIAILAICASFVLPGRISPSGERQLGIVLRRITSVMQLAQARATWTSRETLVAIDVRSREISFDGLVVLQIDPAIDISVTGARVAQMSDSKIGVRFFPDGTATGADIVLKHDNATGTLAINWLSGTALISQTVGH